MEIANRLKLEEIVQTLAPIMLAIGNPVLNSDQKESVSSVLLDALKSAEAVREDPFLAPILGFLPVNSALERPKVLRMITAIRTVDRADIIRAGPERVHFWDLFAASRAGLGSVNALRGILVEPKLSGIQEGEALVEVDVADSDGGIPVSRLDDILQALAALAAVVAEVMGEKGDLRISYADSGSSIALGVIAKTVVAQALKSLLRDGWRQVRFWRENGFDRQIASLGKGLTFLADLQRKAESGSIDPEAAARIANATITSMEKLVGAGVTLREPDQYVPFTKEQLLESGRSIRRLGSGSESGGSKPET